jgi:disulfide bond formation protein DsbB
MKIPGKRVLNFGGAVTCAAMMGFALYAQHVLLLDPCPLCILQRIAVILLGVIFLFGALHNPGQIAARIYSALIVVVVAAGAAVAGWQVRLQNMPADEVPSCGPGLEYMVDNFPLRDVFGMIFKGSGECAEVAWRLFGLSMPAWVVIGLLGLGTVGVWNNLRR